MTLVSPLQRYNTPIETSPPRNLLLQVPEVVRMPCIRRLLCHMEMAARTSENYLPKEPAVIEGRNLEEEVAPEPADPITELQIEAVRALFK